MQDSVLSIFLKFYEEPINRYITYILQIRKLSYEEMS